MTLMKAPAGTLALALVGSSLVVACAPTAMDPGRQLRVEPAYRMSVAPDRNYDGLFALGRYELGKGNALVAVDYFRKALVVKPGDVSALNALGVAYGSAGMIDESVAAFRDAIKADPTAGHLYSNLGFAQLKAGRLLDAEAALLEASRLDPSNPKTRENVALLEAAKAQGPVLAKTEPAKGQTPSIAVQPVEVPKTDASRAEVPKTELLRGDAPRAEAPKPAAAPMQAEAVSRTNAVTLVKVMPDVYELREAPPRLAPPATPSSVPVTASTAQAQAVEVKPAAKAVPGILAVPPAEPIASAARSAPAAHSAPMAQSTLVVQAAPSALAAPVVPSAPSVIPAPVAQSALPAQPTVLATAVPVPPVSEAQASSRLAGAATKPAAPTASMAAAPKALPPTMPAAPEVKAAAPVVIAALPAAPTAPVAVSPSAPAQPASYDRAVGATRPMPADAASSTPRTAAAPVKVPEPAGAASTPAARPVPSVAAQTPTADRKPPSNAVAAATAARTEPPVLRMPDAPSARPQPGSMKVVGLEVSNGVGTKGLARRTALGLQGVGYKADRVSDYWNFRQYTSKIQYRAGYGKQAKALQAALPGPVVLMPANNLPPNVNLRLVVGRDLVGKRIVAWVESPEVVRAGVEAEWAEVAGQRIDLNAYAGAIARFDAEDGWRWA